jgi:hypothetical protein
MQPENNNNNNNNKSLADLGAQIDEWLKAQNDFVNADQYAGILRTLLKLAQDNAERGDLKILNRSMQELRHAFRIFATFVRSAFSVRRGSRRAMPITIWRAASGKSSRMRDSW